MAFYKYFFLIAYFRVLVSSHPVDSAAWGKKTSRVLKEVEKYQDVAQQIIDFTVNGKGKGQTYNRLATFTDKFGNRIAGSQNLENAIDYMLQQLKKDGLQNVHGEDVMVPHWVRGNESATMLLPRVHKMAMLGLGSSVGTPSGGIQAEVLVVKSFDELKKRADEAKGKIIVYNQQWVDYGTSVAYRDFGADNAAKVGGIAALIRSVAPFSINSPHTGWQDYSNTTKRIPTACITIEDAEMMNRMADRGTKIVVHLQMDAKNLTPVKSRNTVAEIVGSKYPEQVVLVSGHLDSWDVGQGAMDDGGGAFISWQALSTIRQMGLEPKRTMRAVMWTAEEEGVIGGQAYYNTHKVNASKYDIVMESDLGTFTPTGIQFHGSDSAAVIMEKVASLLKPINASKVNRLKDRVDGEDISQWQTQSNVPGASIDTQNDKYFFFHHSNGDTMTVLNSHSLDLCSAVWAVMAYVTADLEDMLPR
ncbi:carboxypeptidase Q-like [Lingula anatina]|uniref:Carboxypeptidase Q n=1 Tax=Lingula anatina TaxID=7574 RepID=A0A1S3HVK2_LINAN|nr:carboxypeptidase Q-like [Lingula anatina]|eukprot:XP_013390053.1 carboxypeptidase Q-like [Lingula anatina]